MAGGGSLGMPERVRRGSKAKKRKKKKRIGFVLDMTPMVDIAFLLLTFFMLTTSLITPQVMKMSIPKDSEEVEIQESRLVTIYVRDDNKIFSSLATDPASRLKIEDLRKFISNVNLPFLGEGKEKINVLKIDPEASYELTIRVLDEFNASEMEVKKQRMAEGKPREKLFTISPMDDKAIEMIKGL